MPPCYYGFLLSQHYALVVYNSFVTCDDFLNSKITLVKLHTSKKSHGWRSLIGCSSWGLEESDTTEQLDFHFSLSCIGEGNGNPLQCSCLENPRGGGAWWAAVYGVTQSRTRLKRLSSSSRRTHNRLIMSAMPVTLGDQPVG